MIEPPLFLNLFEGMKIKFIKSPTGTFNLSYTEGAELSASSDGITAAQCRELISAGVAIEVTAPKAAKEIKKPKKVQAPTK